MAEEELHGQTRVGGQVGERAYFVRGKQTLHTTLLTPCSGRAKLTKNSLIACGMQTAKIGSLVDVQDSEDPEGLRVMYYLVQDLKVSSASHTNVPLEKCCEADVVPTMCSLSFDSA